MSFDTRALEGSLLAMDGLVEAFYAHEERQEVYIRHDPQGREPWEVNAFAIQSSDMSAHRRLVRDRFIRDMTARAARLEVLLRCAFPALDHPRLTIGLTVHKPGVRGARFGISLCDQNIARDNQMPRLLEKLKILHDRIGHLERPRETYLVDLVEVPANGPREALRIFIALARPDLFDEESPSRNNVFVVSRPCDVTIEEAVAG